MKTTSAAVVALAFVFVCTGFVAAADWPVWRGDKAGSGVTGEKGLPTQWGPDKNVRWRVDLPERGNATPVVSGNRIFIAQAVEAKSWRGLMCFNRADGKLLWQQGVNYDKPERTHRANPYCSASPATDGERVIVSYGSAGVVCYDLDGKEIWKRDFGAIDHVWGNSTSPVIHGDLVYHYHGPGKGAQLFALNKKTGETVWKFAEPDWKPGKRTDGFKGRDGEGIIGSFSTPIIVTPRDDSARTELIMSFPMEVRSFDPKTGKELWRCGGLNPLVYTSPVYSPDTNTLIAMGGYYGNSIGVAVGGEGDVTAELRKWQEVRHVGGIGSGVTKGGKLYYQDSGGVAYCIDVMTGKTDWKARVPGLSKSWGSLLLAGDHLYTLSQSGETVVFKADPAGFEVVAHNKLGEMTNASITPSGAELFIRTHEALWCIGEKIQN